MGLIGLMLLMLLMRLMRLMGPMVLGWPDYTSQVVKWRQFGSWKIASTSRTGLRADAVAAIEAVGRCGWLLRCVCCEMIGWVRAVPPWRFGFLVTRGLWPRWQ